MGRNHERKKPLKKAAHVAASYATLYNKVQSLEVRFFKMKVYLNIFNCCISKLCTLLIYTIIGQEQHDVPLNFQ